MADITRQTVNSSDIGAIGYDETTQTLEIDFHATGRYRYFSVPKDLFEQLRQTPSPGKYFLQHIKGRFAWEKVGPAPAA